MRAPSFSWLFVVVSLVFFLLAFFILQLVVFLGHLGSARFLICINEFRGRESGSGGLAEQSSSWTWIFVFRYRQLQNLHLSMESCSVKLPRRSTIDINGGQLTARLQGSRDTCSTLEHLDNRLSSTIRIQIVTDPRTCTCSTLNHGAASQKLRSGAASAS